MCSPEFPSAEPSPGETDQPSRRPSSEGEIVARVLIVDDNDINLRVAQSVCELLGFECELAHDGPEAIHVIQQSTFDLVLMDICMPGMDGVQTACAIRDLPGPAAKVPIIAVTANADGDSPQRCFAAGMCAVVQKPVRLEQLVREMMHALEAATGVALRAGH